MKRFGGLFGKKKAPPMDRQTRASTSSQSVRQSYHEGFELLELLASDQYFRAICPMVFPCSAFLQEAGIYEKFHSLINNAGLTSFMRDEVTQYTQLTYYFV